MPHLGQDKAALSVEIVRFTVVGGDVGAAQQGAHALAFEFLALPLAVGAHAVNTVQSTQLDRMDRIKNAHVLGLRYGGDYHCLHGFSYDSPA